MSYTVGNYYLLRDYMWSCRQANLELSNVSTNETKAVIDGTVFPQDGHIGLFLFKDEAAATPYGDAGYSNVGYRSVLSNRCKKLLCNRIDF